MGFPDALKMVMVGHRLQRTSWREADRYVLRGNACLFHVGPVGVGAQKKLYMPTQKDLFANDWELAR